jgi:hypothetical protein
VAPRHAGAGGIESRSGPDARQAAEGARIRRHGSALAIEVLAAQIRSRRSRLMLLQDCNDPPFREPASLHGPVFPKGRTPVHRGLVLGGNVVAFAIAGRSHRREARCAFGLRYRKIAGLALNKRNRHCRYGTNFLFA